MLPVNWIDFPAPIEPGLSFSPDFLAPGEIHVWKAGLEAGENGLAVLSAFLSPAEKERAARLRLPELRRRFICAHAALRQVLGAYCAIPPAQVEFLTAPGGKPFLKALTGTKAFKFNLSHSANLMLLAVTQDFEIGIDVEYLRPQYDVTGIGRHFFSPDEQASLQSLPEVQRKQAFFQLWTCKEAVLKAEGGGIRRDLGQVPISFDESQQFGRCQLSNLGEDRREWLLRIFQAAPEYTAALAYETQASAAQEPLLKFYQWNG